ncbi:MAG: 50S ribosomal protein L9 [Candidatus Hydrogenedentes bacterium]|nr:50S ribosomal protein L9 [Candidatus Hydrogenedentota bacterium]
MKVILSENVPNLGDMGATVKVAAGYARNFLLPRKLAVPAQSGSAKQIEHEMRIIRKREEKHLSKMAEYGKTLEALTVEIKVRAGEEDKIFGSVTSANIAEKLKELGHAIDRKAIHLDEPIKALGIYTVPVRLAKGVDANVKVWVAAEVKEEEVTA